MISSSHPGTLRESTSTVQIIFPLNGIHFLCLHLMLNGGGKEESGVAGREQEAARVCV